MLEPNETTPSTLRQMTSKLFEGAFATPPLRSETNGYDSVTKTSSTAKLVVTSRAASTPPERPKFKHRNYSDTTHKSSISKEHSKDWLYKTLSRKRSQYYEDAFACRESNFSSRSLAAKDSLIVAEVRFNCGIESESDFLIDIAFLLSEIYQRPTGCVMVSIDTKSIILLDSSSEPAYLVAITALSLDVAATKNKRTAGLVQSFMLEAIKIPANRGIVQFHTISKDNIITSGFGGHQIGGITEANCVTDHEGADGTRTHPSCRSRKSSVVMPKICSKFVTSSTRSKTPSALGTNSMVTVVADIDGDEHSKHKVKKRKSLMALLGF